MEKKLVFLLLFFSLILFGCVEEKQEAFSTNSSKNFVLVYLAINDGKSVSTKAINVEAGTSVLDAFKKIAKMNVTYHRIYGAFVTGINGLEQNPKKGLYWQYYIDGELAPVGAADYKLEKNNTVVEFRYEIPK